MENQKNDYTLKECFKKRVSISSVIGLVMAGIINAEQAREMLFDITPRATTPKGFHSAPTPPTSVKFAVGGGTEKHTTETLNELGKSIGVEIKEIDLENTSREKLISIIADQHNKLFNLAKGL